MNENIINLLNEGKSFLIAVSKTAKIDGIASALALALAFTQQGKSVSVCTENTNPDNKTLVGADKISSRLELGGNILKVSFPYKEDSIDKVTYNITDDKFNLLIEPKQGSAILDSQQVQFAVVGGTVDTVITIDTPNLESLGNLYLENPDIFAREKIINIDRRFDNKQYGVENIVDKQSSSTAEIVVKLLQAVRWEMNPDITTNLYAGLTTATNNFTSFSTNAQSFETASVLLKNGARKMSFNSMRLSQSIADSSVMTEGVEKQSQQGVGGVIRPLNNMVNDQKNQSQKQQQKPSIQDWLKPKMFKGNDLS